MKSPSSPFDNCDGAGYPASTPIPSLVRFPSVGRLLRLRAAGEEEDRVALRLRPVVTMSTIPGTAGKRWSVTNTPLESGLNAQFEKIS